MPRRRISCTFLGTGTSSSIPLVTCLTDPQTGCHCCRSTLDPADTEGQKNKRRNTSAIVRVHSETDGERDRTILIDCGKTFLSGALEHWPKQGLREIDAVLLTHAHADAILGLDDLRGWTLRGAIQPTIPIYCTQDTFKEVSKAFPYLTNTGAATGGGDIPSLTWHIFDSSTPFELEGLTVVPLPVHHGKFFTTPPSPYPCLGFLFDSQLAYISDVSHIPSECWDVLSQHVHLRPLRKRVENGVNGTKEEQEQEKPRLKALVIDCLRIEPFTSHFGIGQAVHAAQRLGTERTYLIGFGHRTSHTLWHSLSLLLSRPLSSLPPLPSHLPVNPEVPIPIPENMWENYGGHPDPTKEDEGVFVERGRWAVESWLANRKVDGEEVRLEEGEGLWMRPSRDGMCVELGGEGEGVRDDEYD
ncbi:metallo-beta-lactamase domain containing protein [Rhodotorula toruloides]|nr:metallo-beta-lactamase domain containing protein [Rhodotorula toruloides]